MIPDNLVLDWSAFSETELQTCIREAYEWNGFKCTNFHESGRNSERGVDLLFTLESKQIAFAVKIKPVKSDLPQLTMFSEQEYSSKFYAYGVDPTREFMDTARSCPNTVLMDKRNLAELFISGRSRTYLRFLFITSPAVTDAVNLINTLNYYKETKQTAPSSPDREELLLLFRIKDDLSKSNYVSHFLAEYAIKRINERFTTDSPKVKEDREKELINELTDLFDFLNLFHHAASEKLTQSIAAWAKKYPANAAYLRNYQAARSETRRLYKSLESGRPEELPGWIIEGRGASYLNSISRYTQSIHEFYERFEQDFDSNILQLSE
jgi:hypothetical protein